MDAVREDSRALMAPDGLQLEGRAFVATRDSNALAAQSSLWSQMRWRVRVRAIAMPRRGMLGTQDWRTVPR